MTAMGRRTVLLIASILVAAIGTGLIGLYVRGTEQRVRRDTLAQYGPAPTPPAPPPSPTPSAGHQDVAHLGVSIEVDDPDRVWALLGPGDRVALYVTRPDTTDKDGKKVAGRGAQL